MILTAETTPTEINVTAEDIRHGLHADCYECMLGLAINRVLNPEWAETNRDRAAVELNFSASTEQFRHGTIVFWVPDYYAVALPDVAREAGDKFEGYGQFHRDGPSRDIEPFSFTLDLPNFAL